MKGLFETTSKLGNTAPLFGPSFEAFKRHGDRWITEPATFLDYATGVVKPISFDDIAPHDLQIIDEIFSEYSRFSTSQLVALSHEAGGPWDLVYRACLHDNTASPRIPNELIRRHFTGDTTSAIRH